MQNINEAKPQKRIRNAMYQKKPKSLFKHLSSWFRSHDFYGEPIQLTYKGDSTYKTSVGAIISLVIMGILIAYAVYLAVHMFRRT